MHQCLILWQVFLSRFDTVLDGGLLRVTKAALNFLVELSLRTTFRQDLLLFMMDTKLTNIGTLELFKETSVFALTKGGSLSS